MNIVLFDGRWLVELEKPREFRSFTYNRSGFKLDIKSGPTGRGLLYLSKIGWIPIRFHRDILENAHVKEVTVKKEPTGAWDVSFCIGVKEPEEPSVESLPVDDYVGIDPGVLNDSHDSTGLVVGRFGLSEDRERLERKDGRGTDLSRATDGTMATPLASLAG